MLEKLTEFEEKFEAELQGIKVHTDALDDLRIDLGCFIEEIKELSYDGSLSVYCSGCKYVAECASVRHGSDLLKVDYCEAYEKGETDDEGI